MYVLLKYGGRYSPHLQHVAESFPRSRFMRDKYLLNQGGRFSMQQFVVSPRCHCLYKYCECIQKVGALEKSKLCSNVLWAKECKQALLHKIVGVSGNVKLYSYKVYCYQSIIQSLQRLSLRPGFVHLCESDE